MNRQQIAVNAEAMVYDAVTRQYVVGVVTKVLKTSFDVKVGDRIVRFKESDGSEWGERGRGSCVHFSRWNETKTAAERVAEANQAMADREAERIRQREDREAAANVRLARGRELFATGRVQIVPCGSYDLAIWTANIKGADWTLVVKKTGETERYISQTGEFEKLTSWAIASTKDERDSLGSSFVDAKTLSEAISQWLSSWAV